MSRRKISVTLLAVAWVIVSQVGASAAITKYIDGPHNEWGISVETGFHAWTVDSAAHPFIDTVWVKPDGGPAYRVSSLTSSALLGNIDVANPTYGDVVTFEARADLGRRQSDIRLWDLDNHAALTVPAGVNTPVASEELPSISGDYLVFLRVQESGANRLLLYRFSTQTFTSIAAGSPKSHRFVDTAQVDGDYLVYDVCSGNPFVCNVFRRQISTTTTVEAPKPGPSNYSETVTPDGTVYYVNGSARFCGHNTKILKWDGSGPATLVATLPETIEGGPMDTFDNGVSTTLYFTRVRCAAGFRTGIYRLPNV